MYINKGTFIRVKKQPVKKHLVKKCIFDGEIYMSSESKSSKRQKEKSSRRQKERRRERGKEKYMAH